MSECILKNNTSEPEPAVATCPTVGYQKASVCVPVSVAPFANTSPTVTRCCGNPVVVSGEKPCPGKKNGVCHFTISQTICVEVPVNFGARAQVGDTYVDCQTASASDICTGCENDKG